jgi:hypothetical protein
MNYFCKHPANSASGYRNVPSLDQPHIITYLFIDHIYIFC